MTCEFVHVVSDASDMKEWLSFLLETEGFCVQFYESGKAFLDRVGSVTGCVLTDICMPGLAGMELLRRLRTAGRTLPVVMLAGQGDLSLAVQAMKLGASDVVVKPFDSKTLLKALRSAMEQSEADAAAAPDVQTFLRRVRTLTQRERQVFDHLVVGHSNKETGRDLAISPRTVEIYRARVMAKMQAGTLQGLVRGAALAELIGPLHSAGVGTAMGTRC